MEKEDPQQKTTEVKNPLFQEDFLGRKNRSQNVLMELKEIKEKKDNEKAPPPPKDIFLIITRDPNIFNPSFPVGKFILDISSVVSELHIIYIGKKQQSSKKINENTFIYTALNIPFLNFFTVYKVILSQLVWKKHFLPTTIVSIGDEIKIAKMFSRKYSRPLCVFYSYVKILGNSKISINALVKACPDKIIVPNAYLEKAILSHQDYKPTRTNIKILAEYVDVPELEHVFNNENVTDETSLRNEIFTMIIFPNLVSIDFFSMLKNISKEVSISIKKFQFTVVVKRGQFLQAHILRSLFSLPALIIKENKDSINLFHTSHFMLYFDNPKVFYEPIFNSFISGCPVLSSGDEYSKIILFNSGFEEFNHLEKNGKIFGLAIKRLVNDPYLYLKYKVNCIGFAKTAFTHDYNKYTTELRDCLNTHI